MRRTSAIIACVSFQVAAHQTERYTVATDLYEGPLDLLLELIERAELDITRLALAQVTDPYLEYIRGFQERNAAEVSAFLVIAARLVQIKSAALLPRPTVTVGTVEEEDAGEALARQLLLYKRFKDLARFLEDRELRGLRSHLRVATPTSVLPARLDLSGVTLDDLVLAAREIFYSRRALAPLSQVVSMPRVTIRDRIRTILDRLRSAGRTRFSGMFNGQRTRLEVVVTFLAMLELVKRRIVSAEQEGLFGEIEITPEGELPDEKEAADDIEYVE